MFNTFLAAPPFLSRFIRPSWAPANSARIRPAFRPHFIMGKYSVYFLYAVEDSEAAELLIGAALQARPDLTRATNPTSASASFVFVSDAFIASPECLRSARIITDVFSGRTAGQEVSRVLVLSLAPYFLRRSQVWSETALLFATSTRIDLPYGLDTLTQARLDVIVTALDSAVKAEVAPAHCCTRERLTFCLLCCAILLSFIAISAVILASMLADGSEISFEVIPTDIPIVFLALDKFMGSNGSSNSNSSFLSCAEKQEVTIYRLLGADNSQQMEQTICADLGRVISSRCIIGKYLEVKCKGSWQPWQLEAVLETYPFVANVTRDLTVALPGTASLLAGNYVLLAFSTLPMYILAHSCWFGPFFGRFVPYCVRFVRFAARRPLAVWVGPFLLILLAQLVAAIAFIQTRDFSKTIAAWEAHLPSAQMGPYYVAGSDWDARYTDPVTGGLIYVTARSPFIESMRTSLYGTMATLAVWLLTLFVGSCCTFCNRRGTSLLRSLLPLTWAPPSPHDIEMMQKNGAMGQIVRVIAATPRPVPIVGEIAIKYPRLRVFLSHQWNAKAYLSGVIKGLTEHGFSYWLDVCDMSPGDEMFGKLSEGVGSVDVLVAFVTFDYLQSANCNKELDVAMKSNTPVVVIALQGRLWKERFTWLKSSTASVHPFSFFLEHQCIVLDFTADGSPTKMTLSERITKIELPVLPDSMSDDQFELLATAINSANAMQVPREVGGKYRTEEATFSVAMLHAADATDTAAVEVLEGVLKTQGCAIGSLETAEVVFAVLTSNFLKNEGLVDVRRSTGSSRSSVAQRIVLVVAEKPLAFLSHPKIGPFAAGQLYIGVETDLLAGTRELGNKLKANKDKDDKVGKFAPNPFESISAAWKINRVIVVSGPQNERSACTCVWALLCCSHLCMTRQCSFSICAPLAFFAASVLSLTLVGFFGSGAELIQLNTDPIECPPRVVVVPSSLISFTSWVTVASLVQALSACVFSFPLLQSLWLPRGVFGRPGAACARGSLACSTTFFWTVAAASLLGTIITGALSANKLNSFVDSLNADYASTAAHDYSYNCVSASFFPTLTFILGGWALSSWIVAGCEARGRFVCGGWFPRRR